jgi:hypothetical protein
MAVHPAGEARAGLYTRRHQNVAIGKSIVTVRLIDECGSAVYVAEESSANLIRAKPASGGKLNGNACSKH